MKLMNKQRIMDEDAEPRSHVARRRFLGVVGGGGLATACTVFGFASPASAATIPVRCCHLCCKPTWTLAFCESLSHYVWQCTNPDGTTCQCCEHGAPCLRQNGCVGKLHFSSYRCT